MEAPRRPRQFLRWLRAPFIGRTPLSRRHPLDAAWMLAARLAGRLLATYLRGGRGAAYLRGSIAEGEGVYGFSDLDVVVVVPDDPAPVARRWQAFERALPRVARNVDVAVYEDGELARAVRAPCLRCRPARASDLRTTSNHGAPGTVAEISSVFTRFCVRPDLYRPTERWRLLTGSERRPRAPERDRADDWIAAWHELQWWWTYAFAAALNPRAAYLPLLSMRLVAEPARIWLWIAHGERPGSRREVLGTAIERLPQEEELFRWALELPRRLSNGAEESALAAGLDGLVRLSSRLATILAEEVVPLGSTSVRLVGSPASREAFPLVDWRARAAPVVAEESFTLLDASPADPMALAHAAAASTRTLQPALRTGDLLVMPVADADRAKLRGVQCAVTDPVSFALAAGTTDAAFPDVGGWSARDSACRAVAEHAAWLDLTNESTADRPFDVQIGMLLTAARAALFLETLEAGAPELAVTLDAVAEQLGEIGDEALARLRAADVWTGRSGPELVRDLRAVVGGLNPYEAGAR
jgi:hypothetical protein